MLPGLQIQPLRTATPLEDHLDQFGLMVKREDLSCPQPGPPFSKTRGVIEHMRKRAAEGVKLFGALDTYHSQAGHAVAYGAKLLGVDTVNYFPVYKADVRFAGDAENIARAGGRALLLNEGSSCMELRSPQVRSSELGATVVALKAGRSAVLYHTAKRDCEARGGYMMPNALKLPETLEETAAEVVRTFETATRAQFDVLRSSPWLISCSSATIASGVLAGLADVFGLGTDGCPRVILHMGYSRSREAVYKYIEQRFALARRRSIGLIQDGNMAETFVNPEKVVAEFIDERYEYKDVARPGPEPLWPCNAHYDLKAFRWWMSTGREKYGRAVLWNIG